MSFRGYSIPSLLTAFSGEDINTSEEWLKIRRPEILSFFENNVFGHVPDDEIYVSIQSFDNPESTYQLSPSKTVEFDCLRDGRSFQFSMIIFYPPEASAENPVPAILTMCNGGIGDADPARAVLSDFWPAEQIVASGFAAAVILTQDVAPDYPDGYHLKIHRLFPDYLENRPPNAFGAIAAWSWAASRAMDYFVEEPKIDHEFCVVNGHSRGGKTALWTMARDDRYALCISSNAGNSGDALARGSTGEVIADIVWRFPFWFAENYQAYANNEENYPVDQHMLLSLAAPRYLYTSMKSRDEWADPDNQYHSLQMASPAWELFGKEGLQADAPEEQALYKPLLNGHLGCHRQVGDHGMDAWDWTAYLEFSKRKYQESKKN